MNYLLKNAKVFDRDKFTKKDLLVQEGRIVFSFNHLPQDIETFDFSDYYIFPGFVDVHVHLREPGFLYKETISTGTLAAACGGYTSICSMPNTDPVPDSVQKLEDMHKLISNSALVNVYPYASITLGQEGKELIDIEAISPLSFAFTDDGKGIQSEEVMKDAMEQAKKVGKIICAHCEDETLLNGGYIHDGKYAKEHNHKGISSESEWKQVERDIRLARETGCGYHVCHISTKESVDLIRKAKAEGVDVTCETAPHYLVLCDEDLQEDGRYKMNPPLRSREDQAALIKGIQDGTIDMIATDHAPHSQEEKSKGLSGSAMGIVGLETAFPVLYSHLVKKNIISLEKLIQLLSIGPKNRFNIGTSLEEGQVADLTVFNLDEKYKIDPEDFKSKGKSTPFAGDEVHGQCMMTMVAGKIVWKSQEV